MNKMSKSGDEDVKTAKINVFAQQHNRISEYNEETRKPTRTNQMELLEMKNIISEVKYHWKGFIVDKPLQK